MGKLELDELTKIFEDDGNQILAVDEVDLTVEDGEFLVLVGPSGCGKSTTLRCIAGLERVTTGQIRLDGRDITDAKPKQRNMAMVFQNYALYPHMTVRENIGYGLKIMTDLSSDEIDQQVESTAELLEIRELLGKRPRDLSGGQQQRVALGRAIIREPDVFLMDEPLSNLDAKLRSQMRTEIQQLQQDMGVTTIYVTHDQTEAMTMGDRIAILDTGQLQQVGTPLECYHRPQNQFVAGFIGSPGMNFFSVERDGSVLAHEAFDYDLSADTASHLDGAGNRLTLGIRPEHIELTQASERNAFTTQVSVVEPMGEVTYVYIQVEGETYTVSVDGETRIDAGDEIALVFPEERIHVFDETGVAVKNSEAKEPVTPTQEA